MLYSCFLCLRLFIWLFNVNSMCTSPLKIKNPKIVHDSVIAFNARYDKEFLEVPCGSCPSCQSVKLIEWRSRAYSEFQHSVKTAFLTFTYNETFVPKYKGVNVFCKSDIQKMFKNFRKLFKKKLGHNLDFRYLVTSEYGHNEMRPHYHALFFFKEDVLEEDIFKFAWCAWSRKPSSCLEIYDKIRSDISSFSECRLYTIPERTFALYDSCEHLGMVSEGKNKEGKKQLLIDDIAGINYCTKYILKDLVFQDVKNTLFKNYVKYYIPSLHPESEELVFIGSKFVKDNPSMYLLQKSFLEEFKLFEPFHVQSLGFGSMMVYDLNTLNLQDCSKTLPSIEDSSKMDTISLPLYIQRKLYFTKYNVCKGLKCELRVSRGKHYLKLLWDTYPQYNLTDYGYKQRELQLDSIIDKKCNNFYKYVALTPSEEFLRMYFPDCLDNYHDIWIKFYDLLRGRSLRSLFEYELIFKGRNIVHFDAITQHGFKSPVVRPKYAYQLFNHPINKTLVFKTSPIKYEEHPLFKDFDLCLDILRKFKKYDSFLRTNQKIDDVNTRQKYDYSTGKYRAPRLIPHVPLYKF